MKTITDARKAVALHDEYEKLRGTIEVGITGEKLHEQARVALDFVLDNGLIDDRTLQGIVDNLVGRIEARMTAVVALAKDVGFDIPVAGVDPAELNYEGDDR